MSEIITLHVNGKSVSVPVGSMVTTALAYAEQYAARTSVKGMPRGPLCGMGICFECRVIINGQLHQRACQIPCKPDMEVQTHA